jgi:two-component system NtrC family sensor kinase
MKKNVLVISILLTNSLLFAQTKAVDSLRANLENEKTDTGRIVLLYQLSQAYQDSRPDSALLLAQEAYLASKKIKYIKGESWALNGMAFAFNSIGDFPKALGYYIEQLKIEETRGYADNIASVYLNIALLYNDAREYEKAIVYAKKADSIITVNKFEALSLYSLLDIGDIYEKKNDIDSALTYTKKCYAESIKAGNDLITGTALNNLGNIYFKSGNLPEAFKNYKAGLPYLSSSNDYTNYAESMLGLARIFERNRQNDSAVFYGKKAFDISSRNQFLLKAMDASVFLSGLYKKKNMPDSAFAYQETMIGLKDSVDSREKIRQFQNIGFSEQLRLRELEQEKLETRNTIRIYSLLAVIAVSTVIAFLLFRNNRNRRKTNIILEKQKAELQTTLQDLKNTQIQLIQSEKMASLGELTAGIAHEIQNPLNFVNNFSEVNTELIAEMKNELDKGNLEEVKSIANDIADNGQKINHHGRRADAIVKSMLLHSRSSHGIKEPTDINKLAEEYLRIAYHGVRTKDNAFNVTLQTDFDENIGRINIIPQDIGRVLLNLYNNAFYAVKEKSSSAKASSYAESLADKTADKYEPTVSLSTKKTGDKIEIKIKDNGNGIPQKIVDKIFQPFFTTKPTGQGTGLGLSLSYDIIKAHGGELKVNTGEGFTEFVIVLPRGGEN